jgi:hypothetical protein
MRNMVKDANDEYSDGKWEDVKVVVLKEVVKWVVEVVRKRVMVVEEKMISLVVVVVVEAQWEKGQMKAKPSQENQ